MFPRWMCFLAVVTLMPPLTVRADVSEPASLPAIVRQADLIVEGIIGQKRLDPEHNISGYIGESKNNLSLDIGERPSLALQAEKIYKGSSRPGESIKILSTPATAEPFAEIKENGRYILFLKKIPHHDGFIILDNGRAQFRIFDYNGITRVKTWFQLPHVRRPEAYRAYDDFCRAIEEQAAKTP